MGVHINDDSMSLEIGGATVNAAVRLDNLWRVTGWPRLSEPQRGDNGADAC